MKKTKQLELLEGTIATLGYRLRYEKGTFIGGDCRVRENNIVVVNKFLPIEGKIATLAGIIAKLNPAGWGDTNIRKDAGETPALPG